MFVSLNIYIGVLFEFLIRYVNYLCLFALALHSLVVRSYLIFLFFVLIVVRYHLWLCESIIVFTLILDDSMLLLLSFCLSCCAVLLLNCIVVV